MRRLIFWGSHRLARLVALLTLGAALALAGVAQASPTTTPTTTTPVPTTTTPGPPVTTPTPTPTPPAPQPAAKAKPAVYLAGLFTVQHTLVTVTGRSFTVTGVVTPYVAGQGVLLKAYVGGHLFKTVKLALKPSRRHVYGAFTERLRTSTPGTVSVVVLHDATSGLTGFKVSRSLSVLAENVGFGSTGRLVELIQQRLSALHFYIPLTGVYDQGTGLALDAYHRVLGWGEGDETVGPATINDLLNGVGTFNVRFPNQGRHAEGDLSDQVLALINGSKVYWILPISSGKPSTPTVLGSWQIYERVPGYLPDGMYYSDFFIRGYAIHGYDPAPDYPASHGCMRLPIVDAIPVFNWLAIGDWVDTYYT